MEAFFTKDGGVGGGGFRMEVNLLGDVGELNLGDVAELNLGDVTELNLGDVAELNLGDVAEVNLGDVTLGSEVSANLARKSAISLCAPSSDCGIGCVSIVVALFLDGERGGKSLVGEWRLGPAGENTGA